MKLVGNAWVEGKVYSSSERHANSVYKRGGKSFASYDELAHHLGVSLVQLQKLLKIKYSLDTIYDYLVGELDSETCDDITKKAGFKIRFKVELQEAKGSKPAVYRTFLSYASLADFFAVSVGVLKNRLEQGYSFEELLYDSDVFKPKSRCNLSKGFKFTYNGMEFNSIHAFGKHFGVSTTLFKSAELLAVPEKKRDAWISKKLKNALSKPHKGRSRKRR